MHIFDKVLNIVNFAIKIGTIISLLMISSVGLLSQPNYSAWHFKDGNFQANKRGGSGFYQQSIDSFIVKWATPDISGDVVPLIGNLVNNSFTGISQSEPLEMTALMGDDIVILSGSGMLLKKQKLPMYAQNVKAFTMLFDSLSTGFENYSNNTVLIGSESIEFINPNSKDTLAHSYIFGYDSEMDSIKVVKRLSIDLRDYKPNVSASIKPFYGRRVNGRMMVHAIVDMNQPLIGQNIQKYEYFRGYAEFYDDTDGALFPLPDMKDKVGSRIHFTGEVGLYQPSVQSSANNFAGVLLPWQSVNLAQDSNFLKYNITETVSGANYRTFADSSYLIGFNLSNSGPSSNFSPNLLPVNGSRAIIRPIYTELTNTNSVKSNFILVSEQYSGIDGSVGQSRLHLYTAGGAPLTGTPQSNNPPLIGGSNHYWSVAVGNVDGIPANSWSKYYPNNPGNEIIVTQSTKESVFPESKLFILRYQPNLIVEKPTPTGDTLYKFDTISTARVNGWLAAVADIDLQADGKDEIILVDGSKLMIMRLRDYSDMSFRLGYPLDTIFVKEFRKQTISHVSIADLEGDGKPDIIVTTFDSTYVIGSVIENSIMLDCPAKNGVSSFCINDTINLSWQNIIISQQNVRIKFERLDGAGNPIDTLVIFDLYDNNNDSASAQIIANGQFFRSNQRSIIGRFIVEGTDYPDKVRASSCVISINMPELSLTSTLPDSLEIGDLIEFTANVSCTDSVVVNYRFSHDNIWANFVTLQANNNAISFSETVPCVDGLFDCDQSSQVQKYMDVMLISFINNISDTSYITGILINPKKFSISIDEKLTADPALTIRWNPNQLMGFTSSSLSISASIDGGIEYSEIATANTSDAFYKWNVPFNIADRLILRLCLSPNSCMRIDTLITGVRPKYVDIIAPNPFNPELEMMEFVYKVPENLNITVGIYDQSSRLVKELIKDVARTKDIVYTDRWDGRRSDGNYASNGLYYLIIDLSDGSREIHQVYVGK